MGFFLLRILVYCILIYSHLRYRYFSLWYKKNGLLVFRLACRTKVVCHDIVKICIFVVTALVRRHTSPL